MFITVSIVVPPQQDEEGNQTPARSENISLNTDHILFVAKPPLHSAAMVAANGALFQTMNPQPVLDKVESLGFAKLTAPDGGYALCSPPIFYRRLELGEYLLAYPGQLKVTVKATEVELQAAFDTRRVLGADGL